eukprot:TRINITY_DN14154_c0_g1_i4.p1 TRINITY_DN14154_c0_g1~~TRINITY_DN14154_c0_g1_i4.p1  ORF type:complete len:299 (-),score=60.81 TRINITY_DN14154_c0_g1_i4:251-1147(-)
MVDLNLKREPSFNTFMKTELTSLFENNDDSMMLETPKGGQKQHTFLSNDANNNATQKEQFDNVVLESVLLRTDSRDCFGQPLTRSKSKECLQVVSSQRQPGANGDTRLTRSQSKEGGGGNVGLQRCNTDLIRADSILGNLGFDINDLLKEDFAAPAPPVPAPGESTNAISSRNPPKRKNSTTNQNQSKKQRTSKSKNPTEDGDPKDDPWIGQNVKLTRGKYEGRNAFVLGKTSKKYQVQVEGVAYQLEFYGSMFSRPEDYKPPGPKRSRKKAVNTVDDRQTSFGLTPSMNDIADALQK